MEPPLPASSARRLHYLARLEATGFALLPGGGTGGVERYAQLNPMLVLDGGTLLFPRGQGALRPGAFASVGLGVDHAR
ncbi:hypothetical protein [Archangium sp.]|uniref:hypothetical protein n=1 Tax=Archangium sp. TaxID=1872627 RepID=UPI002D32E030|nr:hypothetical protein [Archangium sp.]HYO52818.1 hypothetical protein [Archangium sp.]